MKKLSFIIVLLFLTTCIKAAITQLDTENADCNLTSQVTVLTDTPDASNPMLCQGLILFGDGTKNLDGSGGNFELTVTIGGQTIEPNPQIITFSTAVRTSVWTSVFPVPANDEVILKAKSPNAADTDVNVIAYLYDVGVSATNAADAVWDEAISGHTTETSFGGELGTLDPNITILIAEATEADANLATLVTEMAEVDANMIIALAELAEIDANFIEVDANLTLVLADTAAIEPITTDLQGFSELGDKIVADMDANSTDFNTIIAAITAFVSGTGVNLTAIEGHALAGTGTRIADGFEYFFNVATPAKTMNDVGIGGAVIASVYNIPSVIDIAGTATVRFSISVTDSVDDLPSTAEITPGTIKIETKRINGTVWSVIVDDEACLEATGIIYYDEVINTASGYREEDALRITFKSQKIVIGGNDFEITGSTGAMFHSYIRKALPDVIYRPW